MLSLPALADDLVDDVEHLVELVRLVVEDAVADDSEKAAPLPRLVGDDDWLRILAAGWKTRSMLSISSTM